MILLINDSVTYWRQSICEGDLSVRVRVKMTFDS